MGLGCYKHKSPAGDGSSRKRNVRLQHKGANGDGGGRRKRDSERARVQFSTRAAIVSERRCYRISEGAGKKDTTNDKIKQIKQESIKMGYTKNKWLEIT